MTWPPARRPRRVPRRGLPLAGGVVVALVLSAPAWSQDPVGPGAPPEAAAPAAEAPLLTLRAGDTGPEVEELQRALAARGRSINADGEFGPRTAAAVRTEQGALGQEPTGVADPAFLAAIGLELREPPPPTACFPAEDAGDAPAGRWLRAFPVVGDYAYDRGFGAPRHQGAHQGVDVMADRGTPVVAVTDATVLRLSRDERGLGGVWIWLRDGAANEFYYAHLDTIIPGLSEGDRVATGRRIGTVGNTGDARHGAHHLHFEVHPGGRGAVDPYADMRAVDPGSGTRTVSDGECAVAIPAPASQPADGAARVTLSVGQLRINQRIAQTAVRRVNRIDARLRGGPSPATPGGGDEGDGPRITLSRAQLLINQRIAQAALRRARGIEARLDGRSPSADEGDRAGGRVTLSRRQMLINQRVSQAAVRKAGDLRTRVATATSTPG